jgi:hypothetical protein
MDLLTRIDLIVDLNVSLTNKSDAKPKYEATSTTIVEHRRMKENRGQCCHEKDDR